MRFLVFLGVDVTLYVKLIFENTFFFYLQKMEYGPIPASRYDDVISHLRKSFPDEPLNASVGLSFYNQPCPLLEKYDLITLQEGLSVMALNTETGEVSFIY